MALNDQSKLMNSIALSDSSDSSSDDIIPMQRRKRQRSYSKRRNFRGSPSSSVFFKSNYTYGLCTLIKFICCTFVIGALTLCLALSYNLYSRLELLQINVDALQSSKVNLPEELHVVHSHLKMLDQNATQQRSDLTIALEVAANLTSDIAQIQTKLSKISESIEAAPTITKLPKDVEDLKKIVADLGSKMASDDKEVKLAREQQVSHDTRLLALESKWKLLDNNISTVTNLTDSNVKLSEIVANLQRDIDRISSNLTDFKTQLEQTNKSQQQLDDWRLLVQERVGQLNGTSSPDSANVAPRRDTGAATTSDKATQISHVKKDLDEVAQTNYDNNNSTTADLNSRM